MQAIKTRATRDGNGYRLTGSKIFITNGQHANLILVAAKTDPDGGAKGISLLAVETDGADGFSRGRNLDKIGLQGRRHLRALLRRRARPPENLLGGVEGQGFYQMMRQLPQERLVIGCGAVGAMEGARRAHHRLRQGAPGLRRPAPAVPEHPLQARRVRSPTPRAARAFNDACIAAHLKGELTAEMAAMNKFWLTDMQGRVLDECLQLFGGYGYMMEYPVAEMWTDARVQRIYGGTNEIMKEIIGRAL